MSSAECGYYISQAQQTLVDLHALLKSFTGRLCLVHTLRSGQIDQVELGCNGRGAEKGRMAVIVTDEQLCNFNLLLISLDELQVDREDRMAPARRLVHSRAAGGTSCGALDQAVGRLLWTVDAYLG